MLRNNPLFSYPNAKVKSAITVKMDPKEIHTKNIIKLGFHAGQ